MKPDWQIFQIEKGSYNEEELVEEFSKANELKLPLIFIINVQAPYNYRKQRY